MERWLLDNSQRKYYETNHTGIQGQAEIKHISKDK